MSKKSLAVCLLLIFGAEIFFMTDNYLGTITLSLLCLVIALNGVGEYIVDKSHRVRDGERD